MVFFVFSLMGSKTCKPVFSSTADEMAESSKPEASVLEGAPEAAPAPTPAESVVPGQPGAGSTEEKIPVIPASDVMPGRPVVDLRTVSPAKSLTPMTQPEEEKDGVIRIEQLQKPFLQLCSPEGCILDPNKKCDSYDDLQENATITAIAQQPKVAATNCAFSLWCTGGSRVL